MCIPNCPDEALANKNVFEELYSPDAVKTRIVEHTTNTRLELQTLLWALESLKLDNETKTSGEIGSITIYTDCQQLICCGGERDLRAFIISVKEKAPR